MRSMLVYLCGFALVTAASTATPAVAQSTCVWGCHCEGSGCACNSNGSGGSCDTGGSGCAVMKCVPVHVMRLAPDGSPVRLAALESVPPRATSEGPLRVRWEYVARGRSAARDCSGVVVARYFDPRLAATVRRRQQTISI